MSDERKPIDWSKPVETMDGRPVRILCIDRDSLYPVVGLMKGTIGDAVVVWDTDGKNNYATEHDLRNVREKIELVRWANIYRHGVTTWATRKIADNQAGASRIARKRIVISCYEGEYESEFDE